MCVQQVGERKSTVRKGDRAATFKTVVGLACSRHDERLHLTKARSQGEGRQTRMKGRRALRSRRSACGRPGLGAANTAFAAGRRHESSIMLVK